MLIDDPSRAWSLCEVVNGVLEGNSKRRVLVVDDHVDTVDALATLLEMLGCEAEVARAGIQAIDVAESFDPDIVMLDIELPDISGFEVARMLREHHPNRYIVAATGLATPAVRERALSAGCDEHVTKPVSSKDIRKILKQSERG